MTSGCCLKRWQWFWKRKALCDFRIIVYLLFFNKQSQKSLIYTISDKMQKNAVIISGILKKETTYLTAEKWYFILKRFGKHPYLTL